MRFTSVARVSAGFSATASATIPVRAGAVSVLLWLFVDAPDVRVAQAGERRAVPAAGRGDPCGGHVVKPRGRVGGPDAAGGGDGGEDPVRVGGAVVQDVWGVRTGCWLDQGFYAARSYSLMRPPRTGRRLIRCWGGSAAA